MTRPMGIEISINGNIELRPTKKQTSMEYLLSIFEEVDKKIV